MQVVDWSWVLLWLLRSVFSELMLIMILTYFLNDIEEGNY